MFMVLARSVAATLAPSVLHAATHDALKYRQTQVSSGGDCHHHGEKEAASGKTVQNNLVLLSFRNAVRFGKVVSIFNAIRIIYANT